MKERSLVLKSPSLESLLQILDWTTSAPAPSQWTNPNVAQLTINVLHVLLGLGGITGGVLLGNARLHLVGVTDVLHHPKAVFFIDGNSSWLPE